MCLQVFIHISVLCALNAHEFNETSACCASHIVVDAKLIRFKFKSFCYRWNNPLGELVNNNVITHFWSWWWWWDCRKSKYSCNKKIPSRQSISRTFFIQFMRWCKSRTCCLLDFIWKEIFNIYFKDFPLRNSTCYKRYCKLLLKGEIVHVHIYVSNIDSKQIPITNVKSWSYFT